MGIAVRTEPRNTVVKRTMDDDKGAPKMDEPEGLDREGKLMTIKDRTEYRNNENDSQKEVEVTDNNWK